MALYFRDDNSVSYEPPGTPLSGFITPEGREVKILETGNALPPSGDYMIDPLVLRQPNGGFQVAGNLNGPPLDPDAGLAAGKSFRVARFTQPMGPPLDVDVVQQYRPAATPAPTPPPQRSTPSETVPVQTENALLSVEFGREGKFTIPLLFTGDGHKISNVVLADGREFALADIDTSSLRVLPGNGLAFQVAGEKGRPVDVSGTVTQVKLAEDVGVPLSMADLAAHQGHGSSVTLLAKGLAPLLELMPLLEPNAAPIKVSYNSVSTETAPHLRIMLPSRALASEVDDALRQAFQNPEDSSSRLQTSVRDRTSGAAYVALLDTPENRHLLGGRNAAKNIAGIVTQRILAARPEISGRLDVLAEAVSSYVSNLPQIPAWQINAGSGGTGSVNMRLTLGNEDVAQKICAGLKSSGVEAKLAPKGSQFVVMIAGADAIEAIPATRHEANAFFTSMMNAHGTPSLAKAATVEQPPSAAPPPKPGGLRSVFGLRR